jgi:hypothetical protein
LDQETAQTIIKIVKEQKPETVQQLVDMAKTILNKPEDKILETVLQLQNDGKIKLAKTAQQAPQELSAYLRTEDAYWYWITLLLAMATALATFTIPEDMFPLVYIRYVLGTVFVLWLPGYSFIKALFPTEPPFKTQSKNLDAIERTALSLGLSLALVPIIGLMLNYTPWGIRLTPIVLSLLAMAIIFSTIAIIREHQIRIQTDTEKLANK